MEQTELQRIIEAILFAAGERVEVSRLGATLEVDEDEIVAAANALADDLSFNRRVSAFCDWKMVIKWFLLEKWQSISPKRLKRENRPNCPLLS